MVRRERYRRPFDKILVALALAIPLEDGRGVPVFFILKFRTMAGERTGAVRATWRDSRTGAVRRGLRRLPLRAVGVLRGEMSLVGPRPERPQMAARIEARRPAFARRLKVRPGIAGLAQASGAWRGCRGTGG